MTLDDQIEQLLLSGMTGKDVIKELDTHSQRLEKVKKDRHLVYKKVFVEGKGFVPKYVKDVEPEERTMNHSIRIFSGNKLEESFNGWY